MRIIDIFKTIALVIAMTFLTWTFHELIIKRRSYERNSGVEIGEIWCEISNEENPFKKTEYKCSKVVDVKNGYVKYLKLPDGYTSSTTISAFKWNSKKIK